MNNTKVLMFDIDGTVLNFLAAERVAVRTGFARYDLGECTDAMLADYSAINKEYWKKLERREMTKAEILVARYRDFFAKYGIDVSLAERFNETYQIDLGDTICFNDNAYDLICSLKKDYYVCAATNGTKVAQEKKLAASGLDKVFDRCFISDNIGFEKPNPQFFEKAFEQIRKDIGQFALRDVIIIGDSLTSDIEGGTDAGIVTCWYNPEDRPLPEDRKTDYIIRNLQEVRSVLERENRL